MIVSGPAGTGKTIAITQLERLRHHRSDCGIVHLGSGIEGHRRKDELVDRVG
ncbi:hypothetical protein [Streptomyces sp. N35]|uniref:hypothetical protein n=1 Tax=Streptomyces sp. N35 TaxID=2795730 RepID=UPI0018F45669|nr:hypothetical protein [Streptomyces sp. N35]